MCVCVCVLATTTKNDTAETKDPKKCDRDFTGDHLQMKQPNMLEKIKEKGLTEGTISTPKILKKKELKCLTNEE